MTSHVAHFQVDSLFLVRTLLQIHFDKNYNWNEDHTKATIFSLSEILYTNELTEDEIQIIFRRYADNHNIGTEISLTGEPEQVSEVFSYLFDLPRYQETYWKNILDGFGHDYSVIDLIDKKEYESKKAGHYSTLLEILASRYADEFDELNQLQKDKFILENFKLIGKAKPMSWYTPNHPVGWG